MFLIYCILDAAIKIATPTAAQVPDQNAVAPAAYEVHADVAKPKVDVSPDLAVANPDVTVAKND